MAARYGQRGELARRLDRARDREVGVVAQVDGAGALEGRRPRGTVLPVERRRAGPRADAHREPARLQALHYAAARLAGAAEDEGLCVMTVHAVQDRAPL